MGTNNFKLVANNKKAYHDYFIDDKYETGIELYGTEVKSIRMGKCSIKEAFVRIENGQVYIYGMHISPYEKGNIFNKDPLRQRKLLIDFFKQHCDEQLTVKEIAGFADIHDKISLRALYRNIDKMLLEGIIQKYAKENGREFVYQYIDREKCAWHLHLKCTNCGKIIHLDDEATDNVRSMLKVKNNFSINEHKTILYGLCSACV